MSSIPARPVEQYLSLDPTAFPVVAAFCLEQQASAERIALTLRLTLRPASSLDPRRLRLAFHNVRELKLEQPEWSVFNLPNIEILSVHDRPSEGLFYLVRETEGDCLSFTCGGFEAVVE